MRRARGRATAIAVAAAVVLGAAMLVSRWRAVPALPRTEVLARLPPRYIEGSAAVSSDLVYHAFQEQTDHAVRMVRDGQPGPVFANIVTRSFAPGSDMLFYWARRPAAAGDENFLVAAGTPYRLGASRHEYLAFSPDGGRWAVLGSVPAAAGEALPEAQRVLILVDGEERGRWADASVPAFTSDGADVAWLVAEPASGGNTRRQLLVDGVARATFEGTPGRCVSPLEAAPEAAGLPRYERVVAMAGGDLAVLVRDGAGWTLLRAGQRLATYAVNIGASTDQPVFEVTDEACTKQPAIAAASLVAAKHAPGLFWWERRDGRWRLVRDGAPVDDLSCERPWDVQPPVVTDDGQAWAYACVTGVPVTGQEILVVTPRGRYGPYREVWTIALSDDGGRVAYGASVEGGTGVAWNVFADGVPFPPRYYAVWRPRFDPSGGHVAWEGIPAPGTRPVLAIDGRNLVRFDELVNGPLYLVPGWASWAVRHGRRLTRINLPLQPSSPLRSARAGG